MKTVWLNIFLNTLEDNNANDIKKVFNRGLSKENKHLYVLVIKNRLLGTKPKHTQQNTFKQLVEVYPDYNSIKNTEVFIKERENKINEKINIYSNKTLENIIKVVVRERLESLDL